jgi:cyclophilin family peptidyl-prolyl cis-trans isomerase/HEAT repeat protein
MRTFASYALLLGVSGVLACTTSTPPATVESSPASQPAASQAPPPASDYGMTVAEEARILALEDQREYDPELVATWVAHPNPLHRLRIALALARIGPHTFLDKDGDRELDNNEGQAGLEELATLAADSDRRVREMAAFALGEIGDRKGAETLFRLTADNDFGVAAEAVEAVSKLGADPLHGVDHLNRYLWMTDSKWPEGPRARAIRFLFRFNDDRASAAAVDALAAPSEAVRQEAAYTLSRRAYAPARASLELLLNDPNVLTRAYAAAALGRIGDGASMNRLVDALGDQHPWVRANAALAMTRVGATAPPASRLELHVPRILAAATDPDPGVRANVIDLLGLYSEYVDPRTRLLDILKNGTQVERELAAGAIAKYFAPDSESFHALDSGLSPWAIVRVIEATATMKHGPAIRARYASLPDPLIRAAVLGAIQDDHADDEIDLIRANLTNEDVIVRTNALDRYLHVTTDAPSAWLAVFERAEQAERKTAMNDARLIAIRGIAERDNPKRELFLRGLLSDSDPVVRRLASDLMVEKVKDLRPVYTPLAITRRPDYEEIVRWSRAQHTATIHMTRGKIELALTTQDAPMTAWNFAQLAKKKFFDDTSFMRVVPNFVIQGGDPRNDMNGGPGYAIRDEINLQKYTRGAVGMALSGPDTGGSQFFITHSPQPHLDGGYTIFGRVYDGMNAVVDQTERGDRVVAIKIDEHPPITAEALNATMNAER